MTARRVDALLDDLAACLEDPQRSRPALSRDDAVAIAEVMHGELDRGTEARAQAAIAMGHRIACGPGCASCCQTVIVTGDGEALRVARWLAMPAQADARAHFADAHPRWRAAAADLVERATAAGAVEDLVAIRAVMTEATARQLMCPFNRDGACTIYPVRPTVCRAAHALDTADNCRPGRTATGLDFVPITRFLTRLRPLESAVQQALPDAPPGRRPLADRVATLLAEGAELWH